VRIDITDFDITDRAEAKFWAHGIDTAQVLAVLDHPWTVIRNRPNRVAPYVFLGLDYQGRCLAIPIVPTDDPLIWRPITAWYCKPSEIAKLKQRRSVMEEPVTYGPLYEPLDDEERELMDSDQWDWEHPIEIRVIGDPGAVLRLRFTRDEYVVLSEHARALGVSTHEFIKQAALAAVQAPAR
jgi:hypothetical protein